MKTQKEGCTTIKNKDGELIAIVYKDLNSRKNVFYSCVEMSLEDIERFLGSDVVKSG